MKGLYKYIYEGIMGDEDVIMDNTDKSLIEKFIKDNYNYKSITISDKPNKGGKYEVSSDSDIYVKNNNITSLTNELFVWNNIKGGFDCGDCKSLKSLEGAPRKVGWNFYCGYCKSLTSLEGAPEIVNGGFRCSYCKSLTSLEGAPEIVNGGFRCSYCKSLTSLKGAPKEVGGLFDCSNCKVQFTEDDVRNVSNVRRNILC